MGRGFAPRDRRRGQGQWEEAVEAQECRLRHRAKLQRQEHSCPRAQPPRLPHNAHFLASANQRKGPGKARVAALDSLHCGKHRQGAGVVWQCRQGVLTTITFYARLNARRVRERRADGNCRDGVHTEDCSHVGRVFTYCRVHCVRHGTARHCTALIGEEVRLGPQGLSAPALPRQKAQRRRREACARGVLPGAGRTRSDLIPRAICHQRRTGSEVAGIEKTCTQKAGSVVHRSCRKRSAPSCDNGVKVDVRVNVVAGADDARSIVLVVLVRVVQNLPPCPPQVASDESRKLANSHHRPAYTMRAAGAPTNHVDAAGHPCLAEDKTHTHTQAERPCG